MSGGGCVEGCWTPVACPVHGGQMTPRGRSAALEDYVCCDSREDPSVNPRHLWNEHDSTRWYTDPDGWAAHEEACGLCGDDGL